MIHQSWEFGTAIRSLFAESVTYIWDSTEHLMKDCPAWKTESPGSDANQRILTLQNLHWPKKPEARSGVSAVLTIPVIPPPSNVDDSILSILFAEPNVSVVRVEDKGSLSWCTHVQIQGVPADGIIDTAIDTTIIVGELPDLISSDQLLERKHCTLC